MGGQGISHCHTVQFVVRARGNICIAGCQWRLTSCTRQVSLSCLPAEVLKAPLLISPLCLIITQHLFAVMRLLAPAAAVPKTVPSLDSAQAPAHFSPVVGAMCSMSDLKALLNLPLASMASNPGRQVTPWSKGVQRRRWPHATNFRMHVTTPYIQTVTTRYSVV